MPVDLFTFAFAAAAFLTGVMGFAIQRGATCMVAAVDEIVHQRRASRLAGMLEAALWVALGLALATRFHLTRVAPHGAAIGWPLFVGAAMLGIGAFVNRACVFGAIARLGSGEWSYLATPVGFFLGCLAFGALPLTPHAAGAASPVLAAAAISAPVLALAVVLRLAFALRAGRWNPWAPGPATVVIGIAFVAMLVLVGERWAYTEVLAELSRGMGMHIAWRGLLFVALFAGALWGGYTARRFRHGGVSARLVARCLLGGFLMGLGSLMIPGSNDGLILLGLPLLLPHAWLALAIMGATIALAMWLSRR